MRPPCIVEGCSRPNAAHGYCQPHLRRWQRHGDPLAGRPGTQHGEPERFFNEALLLVTDQCILWPYAKDGMVRHGTWNSVARAALQSVDPRTETNLSVRHASSCLDRSCFNPKHLSWADSHDDVTMRQRYQFLLDSLASESDECFVWPYVTNSKGYGVIYIDGGPSPVHRLALSLVHPTSDPSLLACHGPCHTPPCFNPRHLTWQSPVQNAIDRHRDGTMNSKLTEADVRSIRAWHDDGATYQWLADSFGVHPATVANVCCRHSWKHVI